MPAEMDLRDDLIFGEFRLDQADERLLGPQGPIRLGNKAFQVLLLLVRQEGRLLSKDSLFSSVWDGTIVSESALTSVIKELRRALGDDHHAPRYIESVYGRGYRFIAPVERVEGRERRSLSARSPAPALHQTKIEGQPYQGDPAAPPTDAAAEAHRPREPDPDARAARARRPALIGLAAVAALAAMAAGLILGFPGPGSADDPPRVKLAAIRTLSPDLPPGIGESFREELVAAFEVDDAMVVTPDTGAAADRTGLAISGTIQRAGDRLRFTTHLRNERSGASLWAQMFELPASFSLAPRQVAIRVSQVVRCGLPGAGAYLNSMSDRQLSLWLQFCQEVWSVVPTTRNRRIDAARRVTAAAPDFSRGWSSLALYAQPMGAIGPQGDAAAMRAEAAHAVGQALRLDPQNSEAYAARAAGFVERHDWVEVERLLRQAIDVRPTDCACEHHQYGFALTVVGRVEDAVDQYRRYRDRQPLTLLSNASLAEALFRAGRNEEGERLLDETLELWPGEELLLNLRLQSAFLTRQYDDGVGVLSDPRLTIPSNTKSALAATLEALKGGRPEARLRAAELLKALARDPRSNSRIVTTALAAIGETRTAIESAERNGFWMRGVLFEPSFAQARRDPTFAALVQRLGMVRYWRQTGRLPDLCREANAPAFCGAL